jgi:Leucine-rich repeat (LRR) protein
MGNELPKHIEPAKKTGILQLRNFKLDKVPPEVIAIAPFLRNLDLSNNKLVNLPSDMFKSFKILKTLNISHNQIGN